MDPTGPNRFPNRKPTPTERLLLGVPSRALLPSTSSSSTEELHEDDVVFLTNDSSSSLSSSSTAEPNHHHKASFPFAPPDSFGILAALPENETSPNLRTGSQLFHNHKASISSSSSTTSSSSSSSRLIPRPPSQERISSSSTTTTTSSSAARFHPQSAPVNVPVLTEAMMKARRRQREFDDIVDVEDDEEEEEEMLPPHEIVARNSAQTPMLACSVLEGVGRTLKGRDLRRVRNAVWRQIGFMD